MTSDEKTIDLIIDKYIEALKTFKKHKHICERCLDFKCETCIFFQEGWRCDYCSLTGEDIKAEAQPCCFFICFDFIKRYMGYGDWLKCPILDMLDKEKQEGE